MLARKERGLRQFIPPFLLAQVAHSPNKIIVGFKAKPRLHHIANTEPLALTSEEAPRALQLPPEHHEAFLGILNLNHNFKIENDQMTMIFDNVETAHVRQLMQASLHSLNRSLDQMTVLQLPIIPVLFLYHKPLLAPVLQHLPHGVVVHIGTLYRHRMLHRLLERELDIQSLKDRIILATLLSLTVQTACIVATREGVLDTVTEEVLVADCPVAIGHRG